MQKGSRKNTSNLEDVAKYRNEKFEAKENQNCIVLFKSEQNVVDTISRETKKALSLLES